ncbi:MAG: hypothetical protein ACD_9C00189G0002 [uncultured bacterium]|nr:MAG: hypothetical protein ACD_9C00189G0002 [uncultured bacterium]
MKKYSLGFWIIFWGTSAVLLTFWYLYLNIGRVGVFPIVENFMKVLPLETSQENEYKGLAAVSDFFLKKDGKEKKFLVLFLNNMEIRPGGGFIGAFGIVKIKNGKVVSMETHDLSNFDAKIPNALYAPYPIEQILKTKYWKMRDSNFSPDFEVNAKKAEEFYRMTDSEAEKFDGVIGITANVLVSILKVTGPIEIEGYPGTYDASNAIMALEYQVEKAFEQQGIERGERKLIMSDLAIEIEKRVFALSLAEKIKLAKILLADLNHKDVQLNFEDDKLQKSIEDAKWAGKVDAAWNDDFLMINDANLGSFKSDYYVKRSIEYVVDLSGDVPYANLKISYDHTAKEKDWMTRDYVDYLRVYVPANSELVSQQNFDDAHHGAEFEKKYFGSIVRVPIGTSKAVEMSYKLPEFVRKDYNLKIQKQAGLNDIPVTFRLLRQDGSQESISKIMNEDMIFFDKSL